jgi:hypothetical protein
MFGMRAVKGSASVYLDDDGIHAKMVRKSGTLNGIRG